MVHIHYVSVSEETDETCCPLMTESMEIMNLLLVAKMLISALTLSIIYCNSKTQVWKVKYLPTSMAHWNALG